MFRLNIRQSERVRARAIILQCTPKQQPNEPKKEQFTDFAHSLWHKSKQSIDR